MRTIIALLVFATATAGAADHPLFASSETLHLTLDFPVRTLLKERRDKPVLDGVMRFTDENGEEVTIEMSMTTRGKSRLDHCQFPPLKVNLKRKQTIDTVFHGQNKLKIVTHCRRGGTYLRYLHQEYGIYRAFNVISDYSYRVRLLRITYRDTEDDLEETVADAFFIESHSEAAIRHGRERLRVGEVKPRQLNEEQAARYTLFQYLIANTDWSMLKGPGEEGCCHNGKVIVERGTDDDWIVLPYDFDQAGLIYTKYSMPADGLGLRNVRQRLYRGRCLHNDQLEDTVALFNDKRAEIEQAIIPEGLNKSSARRSLKYIDDFYEILNTPKQYQRRILDACLGKSDLAASAPVREEQSEPGLQVLSPMPGMSKSWASSARMSWPWSAI